MLTPETIDQINALAIGGELTLPSGRRIRCEESPDDSCVGCALRCDHCAELECCGYFRADDADVYFRDITKEG